MTAARYITALLVGFVVYLAVAFLRQRYAQEVFGVLDAAPPEWLVALRDPLFALSQTLPAFTAGVVAQRHGALLGALLGFASWLAGDLLFGSIITHHASAPGLLRNLLGAAIGAAIVGTFAGLAGAKLRSPPNNSFKPKPLRGSA